MLKVLHVKRSSVGFHKRESGIHAKKRFRMTNKQIRMIIHSIPKLFDYGALGIIIEIDNDISAKHEIQIL